MPAQLSLPWRFALREARRRPGRVALTLLGVALSVAAITAVLTAIDTTRAAYLGGPRVLAGRAALEVGVPGGEGTFPAEEALLTQLARVPGVAAAMPVVQQPATLLTDTGPVALHVLGIDPRREPPARGQGAVRGLTLTHPFAQRHGLAVGATARLGTPRGPVALRVEAVIEAAGPAAYQGGAVALLPLEQAQALFARPGEVTAVQLVLARGASADSVAQAVAEALPNHRVQSPANRASLAGELLLGIDQGVSSLAVIAVVCGALVTLNTLLMQFSERRRQLAHLRALGATRAQVRGLLLRQGLLLGTTGALLGLPVGLGLAALLLRIYEWFLAVSLPAISLSPRAVVLGALLGPVLGAVAALVPARQAAREPPLAGITSRASGSRGTRPRWLVGLGLALLGLVGIFLHGLMHGWVLGRVGVSLLPGVVAAALIGCACLLPLALPMLIRLTGQLATGVAGRLAVRHLLRHPARTALTGGALFAALTVSIAFSNSMLNNVSDIEAWYAETICGSWFVRGVAPDPALVTGATLPAGVADDVARLDGVAGTARLRFVPTRVNDVPAMLIAREVGAGHGAMAGPVSADARAALRRGEALVGTALARRLGVGVGDSIRLDARGGLQDVRIAGVIKEYTTGGMALYLDYDPARALYGFAGPHAVAVDPVAGQEERLRATLTPYCQRLGLLMQSNADFARSIRRVIHGAQGLVAGLVALVCLVAALGVVNTLTTNVLDQTRELGTLRAVGMQRRQVRAMVLWQAGVLAGATALVAGPVGLLLAWLMNRTTPALMGQLVPFQVRPGLALACAIGMVPLAMLAALLPARRAARLAVRDALRSE